MAPFVFTALCIIASLAVAALLYAVSRLTKRYGAGRSRGSEEGKQLVLPPGSMGLPLIGETIQLYSQNPGFFFSNRLKSYGEIFKTHVLGCPCVVLANAEAARMVLVTKAHLFRPTYPPSKMRLLGPSALFYHQGDYHLRLRRLVQGAMSPDALRALVPDVEAAVAATLAAWEARRVESTFDAMKRLAFDVGVATLFAGGLDQQCKEELNRSYCIVERGYNSFANRLPFTRYRRAIQARERLREILAHIVAERRAQSDLGRDLLGSLMRSRDGAGAPLSDDEVADNVIGVLFAAQDTTASVLTWILKYLNDNPKLLEAVKAEQMAAYQENGGGTRPLTWAQTKRMAVTHRVILESLRMASIISFTFREAVADVEYKGFLIPKGWKVMPLFRSIHHSPEYFQDPQKFDPSRFKVSPRPGTFLPFGSGVHACPGNELAKLEMLVLVHRLVTGYRWEVVGSSDDVEYRPFPVPRRGLKARLWRQEKAGVHAAASA